MPSRTGTLQPEPRAAVLIPGCQLVKKSLIMLKAMKKKEEGIKKPKRISLGAFHTAPAYMLDPLPTIG